MLFAALQETAMGWPRVPEKLEFLQTLTEERAASGRFFGRRLPALPEAQRLAAKARAARRRKAYPYRWKAPSSKKWAAGRKRLSSPQAPRRARRAFGRMRSYTPARTRTRASAKPCSAAGRAWGRRKLLPAPSGRCSARCAAADAARNRRDRYAADTARGNRS